MISRQRNARNGISGGGGRETGEGVIELYSDRELCTVTFHGPGGCKISGVLHNEFVGDCTFTGVKVDTKHREGMCDIRELWRDHNECAYERVWVRSG